MDFSPAKNSIAMLPIAMSFTALAVVVIHIALYGVARETDEGTAAHLWQLLMAGQIPIIGYFLFRWLPRTPSKTLRVFAVQVASALVACAPVYWLHL